MRRLLFLLPFLLVAMLWQPLTSTGLAPAAVLPPVAAVARALADLLGGGEIYLNIAVTLARCFAGLALGCAIGIPLGAAMATSRRIDGFFGPLIKATYALPKTAMVPLFILWFGVGLRTEVAAVTLSALLPLVIYSYHGVQGVPRALVWSAAAMGTGARAMTWRILLPASLRATLTGVRTALGFSFIIGIATEMLAANLGIGKLIFLYGESGAYDYMFAAVLALMAVIYAIDAALLRLIDHLLRWQDREAAGG
jgi:ABC-type nitrate/sulfonate/bicarbonate transport system permease component